MIDGRIAIRSIQHYVYCAHRWGLLEVDRAWAENYFVTKANILHERVHDKDKSYTHRGKKVLTSMPVYNDSDEYNIYGVTDCIEVSENKDGSKKYTIVEYKPRKPKQKEYNEEDCIQVFAQKICVDSIFNCDSECVIYYADVKKRIKLPFEEQFDKYNLWLKKCLKEMRSLLQKNEIPLISTNQKCNGCSMVDICMPKTKKVTSVKAYILKHSC